MRIREDVIFCNLWPHIDKLDNIELFSELSTGKYRKVFINAVQEVRVETWLETFGGTKSQFDRCLGEHNIEMMILYGGYSHSTSVRKDPTVNTSIINHPLYFAYDLAQQDSVNYNLDETVPNSDIAYLFSMLNNRKRHNRKVAIDRLAHLDLLKYSIYSWQGDHEPELPTYSFEYFDGKPNIIDKNFNGMGYGLGVPYTVFQSAFQIIGESFGYNFDSLFLTEKTFLGIIRNRPFVLIGTPGLNDCLNVFGFKSYIDEIPYLRKYEDEYKEKDMSGDYNLWHQKHTDYIARFTDIVGEFLYKYKDNPQELFNLFEEKVTFNRARYKEIIDNNLFSLPIPVINFLEDTPFDTEGWKYDPDRYEERGEE